MRLFESERLRGSIHLVRLISPSKVNPLEVLGLENERLVES